MDQGTPAAATGQAGPAEPRWITGIADAVAVVVGLVGIGRERAVVPGIRDLIVGLLSFDIHQHVLTPARMPLDQVDHDAGIQIDPVHWINHPRRCG